MKLSFRNKWIPRIGSLLLLLFSLWCYKVYADVKWNDTLSFAEDCFDMVYKGITTR